MHPQPEDRNVSMTAEIVSIPEIPTDSKSERHEREKQSERSVFFPLGQIYPLTGATFHKIKALLFNRDVWIRFKGQTWCTGSHWVSIHGES